MKNVFFIGDTHFSHKTIINIFRKQFVSVKDHDEALVDLWNSVVKPDDIVFHLGDVSMSREGLQYMRYCNGSKILVRGNHDTLPLMDYAEVGFINIYGAHVHEEFVLTHVPIHPSCVEFSWKCNIHGHIHDKSKCINQEGYFNANADLIDLIPISIDEIRTKIKLNRLR